MRLYFFLLVGILMFTAFASAVTLNTAATGNTTASNSSLTLNIRNLSFVNATINPSNIILRGVFYTQTGGAYNRVVRFNITSIVNHSRANTPLDAGGLPHIESGDRARINIKSNVSNPVNATIENISVTSCTFSLIRYTSLNGVYSTDINTSSRYCSNNALTVNISGIEYTGASPTNENFLEITYADEEPQSVGGGGGGGSSVTSTFAIGDGAFGSDTLLCNFTYNYIQKYTQTDYSYINNLINEIKTKAGKTYTFTEVRDYIDRWQFLCSNAIKQTIQPEFVCKKVYNFLVDKEGKYAYADALGLAGDIGKTVPITINLLDYFMKNYDKTCYQYTKLSLPDKVVKLASQNSVIAPEDCNPDVNAVMDLYIPFGAWGSYSCSTVDRWKSVWAYQKIGGDYAVVGLKLWWLTLIGGLGLVVIIFNTNAYIKAKRRKLSQSHTVHADAPSKFKIY